MSKLTLKEMAERYAREREKRALYYRKHRKERLEYQRKYDAKKARAKRG